MGADAPIIHIGPAKTATTAIQTQLIPYLGRPHEIKPELAVAIAVGGPLEFGRLAPNVIISDEGLGEFTYLPAAIVAQRLATVVGEEP